MELILYQMKTLKKILFFNYPTGSCPHCDLVIVQVCDMSLAQLGCPTHAFHWIQLIGIMCVTQKTQH